MNARPWFDWLLVAVMVLGGIHFAQQAFAAAIRWHFGVAL